MDPFDESQNLVGGDVTCHKTKALEISSQLRRCARTLRRSQSDTRPVNIFIIEIFGVTLAECSALNPILVSHYIAQKSGDLFKHWEQ